MKKILLILIVLIAPFRLLTAQNLKALDEKNGFRDYKFGDSLSKFANLNLIEATKDSLTGYYIKTDDKLTIGENAVEIIYAFYRGQLYSVIIKTKGYINSRGLLKTIEELYGKGYQSNQYMEKYYWFGKECTASYDENSATHDARVYFNSKKISEVIKTESEQKTKNATKDM